MAGWVLSSPLSHSLNFHTLFLSPGSYDACVSTLSCTLLPADLSFNNIEEVGGGLEALVGLRDLSLAHNRLTEVTGFATLTRLQSLSLASNRLDDLQQVREPASLSQRCWLPSLCCVWCVLAAASPSVQVSRLRPLASLQSLCLSGNPLTSDPTSYQHYALAFLPSLVYLDFSMVFTEEVCVSLLGGG